MVTASGSADRSRRALPGVVAAWLHAVLALGPAAALAGLPPPPPVAAFANGEARLGPDLSPNGRLLAWQERSGDEHAVVIHDLTKGATVVRVPAQRDLHLRSVSWFDDTTVLATFSVTGASGVPRVAYEFERTLAIDAASGRSTLLLLGDRDYTGALSAGLLEWRTPKPHVVVMSAARWFTGRTAREDGSRGTELLQTVYEVDTRTGRGVPVASGSPDTVGWSVDREGRVVARADRERPTKTFRILARTPNGWRRIHEQGDGRMLRLAAVAPEPDAVLAFGALGDDRRKLWRIPFDGSGAKALVEDAELDVESFLVDRFERVPVAVRLGGLLQPTRWIDPKAEAYHDRVARAFPGRRVTVYGRSADGTRTLAYVEAPDVPPVYYLVDFATRKADIVDEARPGLAGAAMGRVETTTYPARDGATVPAYVTFPPGLEPRNLPTVVLPHDGPYSRDGYNFDWLAQFLATRGYVVLQPQYRGSIGFGQAWQDAGRRQWGRLMQDDVSDGVRALVARGVTDPARVCIVGTGLYGGYVALAGATLTPELYACAVSLGGASDLRMMRDHFAAQYGRDSPTVAWWDEHVGAPGDPELVARSPVNRAANARAPILLLHGDRDTDVPIAQSLAMERALARAGRAVTLVRLERDDGRLWRPATRIRLLEELEGFLARHLAGPAP